MLHQMHEVTFSKINSLEVRLTDKIITESVIAKLNTNLMEQDAIDTLEQVDVNINYHTKNYDGRQFVQELNYVHYCMLLCHWEHQMPFVFNAKVRKQVLDNLHNLGNLSFSLRGSSQLMISLMRTMTGSLCEELIELTKKTRKRDKQKELYCVQFFKAG